MSKLKHTGASGLVLFTLALGVACGSSETPKPVPTVGPAPGQAAGQPTAAATQEEAGAVSGQAAAASISPRPTATPRPTAQQAGAAAHEAAASTPAKKRKSDECLLLETADEFSRGTILDVGGRCYALQQSTCRDCIPAITRPEFKRADEEGFPDEEPVIGLSIGGEHRAYPMMFLSSHEIVNDEVAGVPVAVTW